MLELSILLLEIIFLLYYSVYNKTRFVLLYFIYFSSLGGFINSASLVIGGVEYGTFLVNIVALFVALFSLNKSYPIRIPTYFFLLFFVYGVIKPIISGEQGFLDSIKASKSFSFYFFVIYVLNFSNKIDFVKVSKLILLLSLYYASLYLVNTLGIRIIPPVYKKVNFLQCQYDSFLSYSLCFVLSQFYQKRNAIKNLIVLYLLMGLCLGGFFNITLTSTLIFIFLKLRNKIIYLMPVFLLACALIGFFNFDFLQKVYVDQMLALDARSTYNEFRWNIINTNFLSGCGFLYSTSNSIQIFGNQNSSYMDTFSFIDSGYVDLLGRFGLMGSIIFLLYPLILVMKTRVFKILLPFHLFILQFFVVNLTWSVFTYIMGVILLAVVYGTIYKEILNNK